MTSIFQRALGSAYSALHPAIQKRYALTSEDETRCVGRGTMRHISKNRLALPVLWAGTVRNLLFPEGGTDVPFEVRTCPFDDGGTETVAYIRRFAVGPDRRFDAYMHYDADRGRIVDALGTNRRLHSELQFSVTSAGALQIETGAQWVAVAGRQVPVPRPFRADIDVTERYDDAEGCFQISVEVFNPLVGRVFAYDGSFTVEYEDCARLRPEDAPANWRGH
ncbi:DUF4166 domain-containing protein [Haloarchaeobius sp. DFWS5]|uniref:DUF4166 domain-containing protein n=1 Tax=Haloarchaeobius sp. DFWS5 TaxID=3446114 RepID=UPI003EB87598